MIHTVIAYLQEKYIPCGWCETLEELSSVLEDHTRTVQLQTRRTPSQGVIEQELIKLGIDIADYNVSFGVLNPLSCYDEF